jgi:hypothetical protein
MHTLPQRRLPNDAFLGASAARISRKLGSLQDFLRMRAGFVDGSAEPLSPMEMMHIVDEIDSLPPLVEAMEGCPVFSLGDCIGVANTVIFRIDANAAARCRTPLAQSRTL